MTVREMIEWLKTQDQDAEVQVIRHFWCGDRGEAEETIFDPKDKSLWQYEDWRENQFVKPDAPFYKKRYLTLGEHDG